MSAEQGNGTNPSTLRHVVEGTETISFGRRLLRAQRGQMDLTHTRRLSRKWRGTSAQKVYSSKLYNALRRSRGSATVRDTADKMLVATARGTTRWSRAILVSRLDKSLYRHENTKATSAVRGGGGRRKKLSAVGSRVRVLGGLVPGCRRTELPELLDEAADYIAALEMQVRAMTALSKILFDSQPEKVGSAL